MLLFTLAMACQYTWAPVYFGSREPLAPGAREAEEPPYASELPAAGSSAKPPVRTLRAAFCASLYKRDFSSSAVNQGEDFFGAGAGCGIGTRGECFLDDSAVLWRVHYPIQAFSVDA